MYTVETAFWDMQDPTKHTYKKGDKFPFDDREIKESRIQELLTNLNILKTPLIKFKSSLTDLSKKEIKEKLDQENVAYEENDSKEELIYKYENHISRLKLLKEAEELNLVIAEEITNEEILKAILESK